MNGNMQLIQFYSKLQTKHATDRP